MARPWCVAGGAYGLPRVSVVVTRPDRCLMVKGMSPDLRPAGTGPDRAVSEENPQPGGYRFDRGELRGERRSRRASHHPRRGQPPIQPLELDTAPPRRWWSLSSCSSRLFGVFVLRQAGASPRIRRSPFKVMVIRNLLAWRDGAAGTGRGDRPQSPASCRRRPTSTSCEATPGRASRLLFFTIKDRAPPLASAGNLVPGSQKRSGDIANTFTHRRSRPFLQRRVSATVYTKHLRPRRRWVFPSRSSMITRSACEQKSCGCLKSTRFDFIADQEAASSTFEIENAQLAKLGLTPAADRRCGEWRRTL